MAASLIQFAFIVIVPLLAVAGALAGLFAVGALFDALDNPDELRPRLQALFRTPQRPPQPPPADHYYRPYWAGRS